MKAVNYMYDVTDKPNVSNQKSNYVVEMLNIRKEFPGIVAN